MCAASWDGVKNTSLLFYHFNTARRSILAAVCPARDQLRLSWTSNRHPAVLNPGLLPLDDQNFPQLQGNTMAAVRDHGFGAIMAQKGSYHGTEESSLTDCCSVVTIHRSESTRLLIATGVREKPPKKSKFRLHRSSRNASHVE